MSAHLRYPLLLIPPLLLLLAACADTEEQGLNETDPPTPTQRPTATPTESHTPVPALPTPTPVVVPADWKTYTDEELGFSLRYPPDLVAQDVGGSDRSLRAISFDPEDKGPAQIGLAIAQNERGLTVEEWAREYTPCVFDGGFDIEAISVDGQPGLTCVGEAIEGILTLGAVFTRGDTILYLSTILSEEEFRAILSSFRILPS